MGNYIVNIDRLTDDQLSFYGWVKVDTGEEFSTSDYGRDRSAR